MANATKNLVVRSERLAFYGVPNGDGPVSTFTRMQYFTALTETKNPEEYERHYVDRLSSDTDTTGYGTSIDYTFDHHKNNAILKDIAAIHDDELIAQVRTIVTVDMFDQGDSDDPDVFVARKRDYSVMPDSSGDGTDALQYSGTFAVKSDVVKGYARVDKERMTCTFMTDLSEA